MEHDTGSRNERGVRGVDFGMVINQYLSYLILYILSFPPLVLFYSRAKNNEEREQL